jgi:glycosyltransferase involved in cell wall biosynthesis
VSEIALVPADRDQVAPPVVPVATRFSVVIPCFNEAGYIAAAIASLRAQTFGGETEIVVVDNNCTDDTAAIARALGVVVVAEPEPGVTNARQRGTEVSRGEIVISADADTLYATDWLDKIDRLFGDDDRVVAVVGPCRYMDGPLWGRPYARGLFGLVNLVYRATGNVYYVSATNIAFRRDRWTGYDLSLTQGGDELDLLRNLRRAGRVIYDHSNPTQTSGRRLTRGLIYNVFVTFLTRYLLTYWVNRLFRRRVLGSAPAFRSDQRRSLRYLRTSAVALVSTVLLMMPFTHPVRYIVDKSGRVAHYVSSTIDRDRK